MPFPWVSSHKTGPLLHLRPATYYVGLVVMCLPRRQSNRIKILKTAQKFTSLQVKVHVIFLTLVHAKSNTKLLQYCNASLVPCYSATLSVTAGASSYTTFTAVCIETSKI